jgi:hypothetical protein
MRAELSGRALPSHGREKGRFCGHFAVVSMAFASLFATFFPLFLEIQHAGHS